MLQIVSTHDGSKTIFHAEIGEHYHSIHGALQESRHVFLHAGLNYFLENTAKQELHILEVGFGTGLNCLLSANLCAARACKMHYIGIEAFPLSLELISQTGYDDYIDPVLWKSFIDNYESYFHHPAALNAHCALAIASCKLLAFQSDQLFDIIYFDAFSAERQPEMWSDESIKHVCQFLKVGGLFLSYAIRGHLKRSLKSIGFSIEKLVGAIGKREMLRATKKY